jgi:hypothetical protein
MKQDEQIWGEVGGNLSTRNWCRCSFRLALGGVCGRIEWCISRGLIHWPGRVLRPTCVCAAYGTDLMSAALLPSVSGPA